MHPGGFIGSVFCSCSVNVMILEVQIRTDPGCANLITFCQFVFVAIIGFITVADFGRRKPVIPIRHYLVLTTMYFLQGLTNNKALSYSISMPIHMIVKSGSLCASMLLGVIFLRKRYPISRWISVFMVTCGIALCTLASAKQAQAARKESSDESRSDLSAPDASASGNSNGTGVYEIQQLDNFISWCTGVSLVGFSVFMAAGMGIYQEYLFGRFGRHAREGIFYSHALPLPGFLFVRETLLEQIKIHNHSEFITFFDQIIPVPKLWLYMMANVVTYYVCSSSVFSLVAMCSSLTVTLVLTLRKFLSLFISIYLFNNAFTGLHWVGTCLVIIGTMIYVDLVPLSRKAKEKTV